MGVCVCVDRWIGFVLGFFWMERPRLGDLLQCAVVCMCGRDGHDRMQRWLSELGSCEGVDLSD